MGHPFDFERLNLCEEKRFFKNSKTKDDRLDPKCSKIIFALCSYKCSAQQSAKRKYYAFQAGSGKLHVLASNFAENAQNLLKIIPIERKKFSECRRRLI